MTKQEILNSIQEKSCLLGNTWPLYSFVTSNPLSGFEKISFAKGTEKAAKIFNAKVFPEASHYRDAFKQGVINEQVLNDFLKDKQLMESPEFYLQKLEKYKKKVHKNETHGLDQILVKWLSLFMDEGMAEWEMPYKNLGFYIAWKNLARFEKEYQSDIVRQLPSTAEEALAQILSKYSHEECAQIFQYHLAALPGWVGYIKHRTESNSLWQDLYPISLVDYLAVRLSIAKLINTEIVPKKLTAEKSEEYSIIQYVFLQAWEKSYQENLLSKLNFEKLDTTISEETTLPVAQMVFCIDTRSELIRRHVESKGKYETFGYAGFFGIAMDYHNPDDSSIRKSCPPILASAYIAKEVTKDSCCEKMIEYQNKNVHKQFGRYFLHRMKNMLPSTFGFVEGAGFFYGLTLVAKTLLPNLFYQIKNLNKLKYEALSQPELNYTNLQIDDTNSISLDEKVAIVKSAFDLMGWEKFAPLVLFVGHGSHTTNNPFGSSLDCGACAASPGRHNARMLSQMANQADVRKLLIEKYNINLTHNTIFIGAEHNTTTDEITIFDANIPITHIAKLGLVKVDLQKAKQSAAAERLSIAKNSVQYALKKCYDWAETRPEWGLAKNAGFIIGPRSLTEKSNLDGRCFLHSYDWKLDESGKALEAIMQGPMVVTQWINNHYYFSTVDNEVFGGGSKITHNVTGNFGVVQGNGDPFL